MITNLPTYDEARKAIRGGKDPMAFLHLGIMYASGIGTTENHVLACYFYKRALDLGCQEAEKYLNIEYETGTKDLSNEINATMLYPQFLASDTIARLKKRLEKERIAGNYGVISKMRKHLGLFYPSYSQEQAIEDILNHRDTIDADIFYSICTTDNKSEKHINSLESVLSQLYAPIIEDSSIMEQLDNTVMNIDEAELLQCVNNLIASYDEICERYKTNRLEQFHLECLELYPYIKIKALFRLRRQVLRCLLAVIDLVPDIRDNYLANLDNDDKLLNICEGAKDQSIQIFLISFIELNIDIEALIHSYQVVLISYRNNNYKTLAKYLNALVERLNDAGIKHDLPTYAEDNLPPIKLPDCEDCSNGSTAKVPNKDTTTKEILLSEKPISEEVRVKEEKPVPQEEKKDLEFTVHNVPFKMIYVEGGTFQMGAPDNVSDADSDERPLHPVTLNDFHIGETQVTQALWKAVMGTAPFYFKGDDLPAENVSWDDCQEFIKKLNQETGRTFRLPTEAEWEYAAYGGKKREEYKYAGSDDIDSVAWHKGNSDGMTHPVAKKQANELGLYDMSGNVLECCQDIYDSDYYKKSPDCNPCNSSSGLDRVLRGGSWDTYDNSCRFYNRFSDRPNHRSIIIGLRLVLA